MIKLRPISNDDIAKIKKWPPYQNGFEQMDYALRDKGWLDEFMNRSDACIYAAEESGKLAGFSLIALTGEGEAEFRIALHPRLVGKGIGRQVTFATLQTGFRHHNLSRIHIIVRKSNPRAAKLYEKTGFRKTGESVRTIQGKQIEFVNMEMTAEQFRIEFEQRRMTVNSKSAKLIYFSPTQTSKKILESIARGVQMSTTGHIDLTPPGAASQQPFMIHDDLAIIGSPVYTGRVPVTMAARLGNVKGNNTPAVIVVVYGNRAYEDALLELRDLAVKSGFHPVAAAAFIGEHSYSTKTTPVAVGRPDHEDLSRAAEFGLKIREKMKNRAEQEGKMISVPGNYPYRERGVMPNIAPVTDDSLCTLCGHCSFVCPTAAITIEKFVTTDAGKCIRCCACVKICGDKARSMQDRRIRQVAEQLSKNCSVPKEPETYL